MDQPTLEDFLRLHLSTLGYKFNVEAYLNSTGSIHFQIKAEDRESDTLQFASTGNNITPEGKP